MSCGTWSRILAFHCRHTPLLRGCDGALHARGGLRGVDRGLPSVRSARGLQGRQELGRNCRWLNWFLHSPSAAMKGVRIGRNSQCGKHQLPTKLSPLCPDFPTCMPPVQTLPQVRTVQKTGERASTLFYILAATILD